MAIGSTPQLFDPRVPLNAPHLGPSSTAPIYEQIAASIRGSIAAGTSPVARNCRHPEPWPKPSASTCTPSCGPTENSATTASSSCARAQRARREQHRRRGGWRFHQALGAVNAAWATTRHRTARGIVDPREGLSSGDGQPLPSSRRDRRRLRRSLALPRLIVLSIRLAPLPSRPHPGCRPEWRRTTAGVPGRIESGCRSGADHRRGVVPRPGWLAGRMLTLTPAVDAISSWR